MITITAGLAGQQHARSASLSAPQSMQSRARRHRLVPGASPGRAVCTCKNPACISRASQRSRRSDRVAVPASRGPTTRAPAAHLCAAGRDAVRCPQPCCRRGPTAQAWGLRLLVGQPADDGNRSTVCLQGSGTGSVLRTAGPRAGRANPPCRRSTRTSVRQPWDSPAAGPRRGTRGVGIWGDPWTGRAAPLSAGVAARGPDRRCHCGGLPGPAGHGVRDGRRAGSGRWLVGGPAGAGGLCRARLVAVLVDGAGGDDRADDCDCDRAAGRRRAGPLRHARRHACAAGRGDVSGSLAAAAGLRGGPAVAARPGRLHGRAWH
jgi:hypothetical protein